MRCSGFHIGRSPLANQAPTTESQPIHRTQQLPGSALRSLEALDRLLVLSEMERGKLAAELIRRVSRSRKPARRAGPLYSQTKLFRSVVRDHMGPKPVEVPRTASVGETVNSMAQAGSRVAIVTDSHGRPAGILT